MLLQERLQGLLPHHTYGGYPGYSTGYNAGYGRSGSTLLDLLLGRHDGLAAWRLLAVGGLMTRAYVTSGVGQDLSRALTRPFAAGFAGRLDAQRIRLPLRGRDAHLSRDGPAILPW